MTDADTSLAGNGTAGTASLEHLTGHSRGTITWLTGDETTVVVGRNAMLRLAPNRTDAPDASVIAILRRKGDTYEIEAAADEPLWINGTSQTARLLAHNDLIEFGERGPVSRFCLYHERDVVHRSLVDVIRDAIGYLRVSRQPMHRRLFRALGQIATRLTLQTSILFRIGVILSLAALAVFVYQQRRVSQLLQTEIERSTVQLESFARSLDRTRNETITPADLEALRLELNPSVSSHEERLNALERRWSAAPRIIARASPSVMFLQGGYGFRETATGRMLRHIVTSDGRPMMTPYGTPLLSLEGEGPVVERQFSGTGFVMEGTRMLITNRHVALAWEKDVEKESLKSRGLEPVLLRFHGYLPGRAEALELELVRASDTADLALVRPKQDGALPSGLGLSLAQANPQQGDEVLILGYPTGLRSMLVQAGEAFVKSLQDGGISGFWAIAEALAKENRIRPLASRGIVSQAGGESVVYDAETTSGGSGGPVLNSRGRVLAVNSAIIPSFGGSNIGVPYTHVRALLDADGGTAGQGANPGPAIQ